MGIDVLKAVPTTALSHFSPPFYPHYNWGIIFPREKGMKMDRRRKREKGRKGWKNSRARNTKYYTIFSTRVVSDEKLEIRKTNGSTGGTITRREFSPISFVRFRRAASRAWQTWSERNRSLYPLRFFSLPLLLRPPSHSTARLLFVLLLFVLQTQLVQSTLVVRADGGIIMAACALARLMRSGKIRPSVCARPSDAC